MSVFSRKPQSLTGFAVLCVVFVEFIWLADHFVCVVSVRNFAFGAHGLGGYDLRGSICVFAF